MDTVSERIDRIVDEFVDLDGRENYCSTLPTDCHRSRPTIRPASSKKIAASTSARRRSISGPMTLVAEVAEEAPTVKGFVALLAEAVAGRPQTEATEIEDDLLDRIGLTDVLGMLRSRGLRAIVGRVRKELLEAG